MRHAIFVDGQEGTTGLRIHDVLAKRADIELLHIDPDHRKDSKVRAKLLNSADVAFLCLPDAAAREAVGLIDNPNTCVIDASTAHRTSAHWAYGLPELTTGQRAALHASTRIANPGCHASAFILLIRPLIDAGLIPRDAPLTASSITGYSGGGKKMIEQYRAARTASDGPLSAPRPYALTLQHKHLPEMALHSALASAPLFQPIVADFYKGLAVSVPLQRAQLRPGSDARSLHDALARRYEHEAFVNVMPLNDPYSLGLGHFDVQACNDSNRAELFVFANEQDQVMLMARLDNLGKGASGAAVQCMNIRLGLDEAKGL